MDFGVLRVLFVARCRLVVALSSHPRAGRAAFYSERPARPGRGPGAPPPPPPGRRGIIADAEGATDGPQGVTDREGGPVPPPPGKKASAAACV